jgi:hypothetical protein
MNRQLPRAGLQRTKSILNQELSIIAELRSTNEKSHQLTHTLRNLLTVQRLLLEQIRGIRSTLRGQVSVGQVVLTINITEEEEPPKPPPDEGEPKPPVKEPPTEEPPVKEPPPKK